MIYGMTSGPYPPAPPPNGPAAWPGLYPLRPLAVGEILGSGLKIATTGAGLLVPLAIGIGVLAQWVQLGAASLIGGLDEWRTWTTGSGTMPTTTTASGQVVPAFPPLWIVWPTLIASLVSVVGVFVLVAMAGAIAAEAGLRRPAMGAVKARLAGRWAALLPVALASTAIVAVGSLLLIVPGIIAYVTLLFAGIAVSVEGLTGGAALRRSAELTRGRRWRLFGIILLIGLIVGVIDLAASSLVNGLVGVHSTSGLWITGTISGAVSAVVGLWTAGVVAVLYVDTRFRAEGLDAQLRGWADRGPLEK